MDNRSISNLEPASPVGAADANDGIFARSAARLTLWTERWFPDAFVFATLAVILVAGAAILNGAPVSAVTKSFGDGFWSLITFTMQMALVVIGGYVVAISPPASRLIDRFAAIPTTGRSAIGFVAAVSTTMSLLNWGFGLIFAGLLVRAIARRQDLVMDYRAAGAAAYLGMGGTWALGLSSSAAQLQANAASLPKALLPITGVIPFAETIFLWQSIVMAIVLIVVSVVIAVWSSPSPAKAMKAQALGVTLEQRNEDIPPRKHPGEWLDYSPTVSLLIVALGLGWLAQEFSVKDPITAVSSLNTYNLLFLLLGLLLHWRPKSFLVAVASAVPATSGVLIQFPFYGAVAAIMTGVKGADGATIAEHIAHLFVSITNAESFPVVMGVYSAVLGFFIPSGGGKWIIEAPYVMQAANELKVHLGWAVQVYNAAEALPNLINPFWMLPLLGVLGLKAREIVGFTFIQLVVHTPLVLFMLWILAGTLSYHPPAMPG